MRDCWAADHHQKEVKCTMTDLTTVLEAANDTIIKVVFHKKIDAKQVQEKLQGLTMASVKDDKKIKELSKHLIEGEECEIVGHLIDSDNFMGRSMIVDLNAPANNNIRQIDHRTIQSIVFKNVKYSLGRKAPGSEEVPLKPDYDGPKWEASKLKKGNWFSQVTYYKVMEIDDENVQVRTMKDSQTLTLSKDILQTEMNSGHAFEKEEKVTRTQMIEILQNARESCMTLKFHKKVDDKYVKEQL